MEAIWRIHGKRADFDAIGREFNINPVVARVMVNRDVATREEIDRYLNCDLSIQYDPALMKDMDKACRIMWDKISQGKSIRIISDYDVDGVMSNYVLLEGLKELGADVSYEIPDRMTDGYGINERIIRDAHKDGIDTLITCDNGIGAFDAVNLARELGMTVIVTDHHEPPVAVDEQGNSVKTFAEADAVIDPKRPDCQYPFKEICGAMVAYKFIRHMFKLAGRPWVEDWLVEMVGIATVCDVMPLKDENRAFVKRALTLVKNTENKSIAALLKVHDLMGKRITTSTFGFIIGPCINASGRLDSAKRGLELLLSQDEKTAITMAGELKEINISRKDMTEKGKQQAMELVESRYMEDTVLVVYMPELHESLAGIVAGRLKEKYYKPTLVFTRSEKGFLKGSGRSIEPYDMHAKLSEHKELFLKMGGHPMAAGFSIEVTRVVAKGTGEQVGQVSDQPLIGDGVIVLPTGEVLTYVRKEGFVATAYTHTDAGCDEYTSNGTRVKWGVVAVDPTVIPYGTRMFIVTNDGKYVYGLSTAEDCGGAIQNRRLDLYMPTTEECFKFGVRDCTVYFLGDANWRAN